jgi:hypothetical protein
MMHHICIHDDYCTFDGEMIPLGKLSVEREVTKSINEILDMIVHKIGKSDVVVCGVGDARRMVGRKLEDRIKREVKY